NHILRVADVTTGQTARWKRIFLAEITPPDKLPAGVVDRGDSPRVTIAPEAIAAPDVALNRLQLTFPKGSTYEAGKDPTIYSSIDFKQHDQALQANRNPEQRASRPTLEMDTLPLYRETLIEGGDRLRKLEAEVELHQRLALPFACCLLALVGIPLGI